MKDISDSVNTRSFKVPSKGSKISHYKIVEKLGVGGMGEVFLAEDTKLERQVALKFLPRWLSEDENARHRLTREAMAASKLNHPCIVSIYAIEESEGRLFIAMEHVEGESLKKLVQNRELTIDEIIDMAARIGEGLDAAHRKGIVHRDIKSDNIIVTPDMQVKILDFGLALFKGGRQLTESGSTVGTMAYMSPEQARGDKVDHRSDIFSFGVVLYELIAGRLPFKREHQAHVVYSIVYEPPEPLARYKAAVPDDLQRIISKCLEKDPSMRYQTVSDLLGDLRRLTRDSAGDSSTVDVSQIRKIRRPLTLYGLAAVFLIILVAGSLYFSREPENTIRSIAVLPLENLSGDPEQEYFVDGMTDALITELARISALRVTSRTSTIRYKGVLKPVKEIADELNVDAVVEGSVLLAGDRVRITAQLIHAPTDRHLWADNYERDLKDILVLQSKVANAIAREIEVAVTPQEQEQLASPRTVEPDGYRYFLRGNVYLNRSWSEQDISTAVDMYQKAAELDPEFAIAYASLSIGHSAMYSEFHDHTHRRLMRARQAVDKALYLEPDLPDAHYALGMHYYNYQEHESAMIEFSIALRSQPNNSDLYSAIAAVQRDLGEIDSALVNYKTAFRLDPLSPLKAFNISYTYGLVREYFTARAYLDSAISIAPDWPLAYIYKAWLCVMEGSKQDAARVLSEASRKTDLAQSEYNEYYWWLSRILDDDYSKTLEKITLGSDTTSYYLYRARIYGLMDKHRLKRVYSDSARALLEPGVKSFPDEPRYHSQLGLVYAGLGQKELAIDEGVKGVELSHGPLNIQFMVKNLAEIYVITGEFDLAIEALGMLLSIPGLASTHYLQLDPLWVPLHEHPEFLKLLGKSDIDSLRT